MFLVKRTESERLIGCVSCGLVVVPPCVWDVDVANFVEFMPEGGIDIREQMVMDDPNRSDSFLGLVQWLVRLATGELALVIATIAVAIVGLMMLDGRLDWRRGARVIVGCFLIFGASTISAAFMGIGNDAVPFRPAQMSAPQPVIEADTVNDPWASAFLKPEAP